MIKRVIPKHFEHFGMTSFFGGGLGEGSGGPSYYILSRRENYVWGQTLHLGSSLNQDLELRSSSCTLGNESELSFHSLNHDLFTITDEEALAGFLYTLALEVVIDILLSYPLLNIADRCSVA